MFPLSLYFIPSIGNYTPPFLFEKFDIGRVFVLSWDPTDGKNASFWIRNRRCHMFPNKEEVAADGGP